MEVAQERMSVRLCKYCNKVEIDWDKNIVPGRWTPIEKDGTVHDRTRCESLRPITDQTSTPTTMGKNPIVTTSTVQLPTADWDKFIGDFNKVIDLLTKIADNVNLMTDHYDGLVEQQRQLTRLLTRPLDEKAQAAEAAYDQDREEGFA